MALQEFWWTGTRLAWRGMKVADFGSEKRKTRAVAILNELDRRLGLFAETEQEAKIIGNALSRYTKDTYFRGLTEQEAISYAAREILAELPRGYYSQFARNDAYSPFPRPEDDEDTMLPNASEGTVRVFVTILTGLLTQYDQAETVRELRRGGRGNIYRLGHLLKAAQGAEADVTGMLDRSDAEAIAAYRAALQDHFIYEARSRGSEPEFALAPLRKLDRMMRAWVEQGKRPRYQVSKTEHSPNADASINWGGEKLYKNAERRRELHFAGYDFTSGPSGTVIQRERIDTRAPGDHGADPLGDGRFRMVPSGDIVDFEERNRRLKRHRPNRRLQLGPPRIDEERTQKRRRITLKANRNSTDLNSIVVQAAYYAQKTGQVHYVFQGNSFMHTVYRATPKLSDVLSPINNTGDQVLSVAPDRTITWFDVIREQELTPNGGYYVWPVAPDGVSPLSGEGPYGPYDLWTAQQYARISATEGRHDRAVSHGLDPNSKSFRISQIYRAGTGEPAITAA